MYILRSLAKMGMLTSPFWLKLLWVLHLRLRMSTGAAQPLEEAQEPAQDLEAIANELHTQHYGPQSLATKCSWCLEARQLQTIQHHFQKRWRRAVPLQQVHSPLAAVGSPQLCAIRTRRVHNQQCARVHDLLERPVQRTIGSR